MDNATIEPGADTIIDELPGEIEEQTPPNEAPPPQIVKLSFNVAQHQVDTLRKLANRRGVSMTEVLRHAIALEEYVQEQAARGNRIVVENEKGGNRRELVLIGS